MMDSTLKELRSSNRLSVIKDHLTFNTTGSYVVTAKYIGVLIVHQIQLTLYLRQY